MNEALLGFQLRLSPRLLPEWEVGRRARCLLTEVRTPLSVDEAVWPLTDDKTRLESLFANYYPGPYSAPNGLGVYELNDSSILSEPSEHNGSFLIGIAATLDSYQTLLTKHRIEVNTVRFEHLEEAAWKCLGFDVADDWLLSGLMNCGYDLDQKKQLSIRYGGLLNNFGLFHNIADAQPFCTECDRRVAEHSPFHVFGIWSNGEPF